MEISRILFNFRSESIFICSCVLVCGGFDTSAADFPSWVGAFVFNLGEVTVFTKERHEKFIGSGSFFVVPDFGFMFLWFSGLIGIVFPISSMLCLL